jgi:hypothetical protein
MHQTKKGSCEYSSPNLLFFCLVHNKRTLGTILVLDMESNLLKHKDIVDVFRSKFGYSKLNEKMNPRPKLSFSPNH